MGNGLLFTPAIMESAAAGLVSTAGDMARWEIALQTGTILKPATLAQMEMPIKLNNGSFVQQRDGMQQGLGWVLQNYQGHRMVWHGGDHVTGFTANFARFPDDKLGVIVLTNLMPLGNIGDITKRIASFYVPELAPIPPKPSIAETLLETIKQKGITASIEQYRTLKKEQPNAFNFAESELNRLGYLLLNDVSRVKEAIEIFKLNVEVYPESANVYDSLGEAYMKSGDTELAIKNYRRSLEFNPQNANAIEMLKKLSK